MQSSIIKHSVEIAGHKTSISLEEAFWRSLKDIARSRRIALNELVSGINSQRTGGNLSSAIRLFVLKPLSEPTRHRRFGRWISTVNDSYSATVALSRCVEVVQLHLQSAGAQLPSTAACVGASL